MRLSPSLSRFAARIRVARDQQRAMKTRVAIQKGYYASVSFAFRGLFLA
jgi:hypothetical protein